VFLEVSLHMGSSKTPKKYMSKKTPKTSKKTLTHPRGRFLGGGAPCLHIACRFIATVTVLVLAHLHLVLALACEQPFPRTYRLSKAALALSPSWRLATGDCEAGVRDSACG
jgi:hypothetical protein